MLCNTVSDRILVNVVLLNRHGATARLWCYIMVKMAGIDIAVHDLICGRQDEQLESH